MIKKNKNMEKLINSINTKKLNNIENLCENIVCKTKFINGCIIYDPKDSFDSKSINWEFVIKINKDYTGYEVNRNELIIEKEIFSRENIYEFLNQLKLKLKLKYSKENFCIIMSHNGIGTLRFHIYRPSEGLWVSSEIENYKEAILVDLQFKIELVFFYNASGSLTLIEDAMGTLGNLRYA